MNPLSTAMAAGAKAIEALPAGGQARAWGAIQKSHLALYRLSGRRLGTGFRGVRVLFLHHFGAKSGVERISPLLYVEDGDNVAIIASKGGYVKHPAWFHNLKAHPDVRVELRKERELEFENVPVNR